MSAPTNIENGDLDISTVDSPIVEALTAHIIEQSERLTQKTPQVGVAVDCGVVSVQFPVDAVGNRYGLRSPAEQFSFPAPFMAGVTDTVDMVIERNRELVLNKPPVGLEVPYGS